jgi:hypothetical protein
MGELGMRNEEFGISIHPSGTGTETGMGTGSSALLIWRSTR